MKPLRRHIIDHEGQRLLLQETPSGKFKYSMYKFVNGEQFGISTTYPEDSKVNRDTFITEALKAFGRARAAPFN